MISPRKRGNSILENQNKFCDVNENTCQTQREHRVIKHSDNSLSTIATMQTENNDHLEESGISESQEGV